MAPTLISAWSGKKESVSSFVTVMVVSAGSGAPFKPVTLKANASESFQARPEIPTLRTLAGVIVTDSVGPSSASACAGRTIPARASEMTHRKSVFQRDFMGGSVSSGVLSATMLRSRGRSR